MLDQLQNRNFFISCINLPFLVSEHLRICGLCGDMLYSLLYLLVHSEPGGFALELVD